METKNNKESNSNLKRRIALAVMQSGSTCFLHINCELQLSGLRLPLRILQQSTCVLQIGRDMPIPIPDLLLDSEGVIATLTFKGTPFRCSVPWEAVYGIVADDGKGKVWDDEVPEETFQQITAERKQLEQTKNVQPSPIFSKNEAPKGKRTFPDYLRLVK